MGRYWRQLVAVLIGGVVLVGGYTAAARLKIEQPPSVPSSFSQSPSSPMDPSLPPGLPPLPSATAFQRGIDVDFYAYPGQDVAAAAAVTVDYARSLHANAISISFPFFMASRYAAGVYAGAATPTPDQLATVIIATRRAGMRVTLRPLLDEKALGKSRVKLRPVNEAAWFASYRQFLVPYLVMAQQLQVSEFITGAELTQFSRSPRWKELNVSIHRIYHGQLGCSDNLHFLPGGCGTGVQLVDAYQPLQPPLAAAWRSYDATFPRGTVLAEVGIAAVYGAWTNPSLINWPVSVLDPAMQAQWFTDACHAATAAHLSGIYFWSLNMSVQQTGPTLAYEGQWAHSAGASAISRCFASIEKGGS
ncbi:MAG: glycoside hydrolase family 113 [Streptosporangiaceae bacterium]